MSLKISENFFAIATRLAVSSSNKSKNFELPGEIKLSSPLSDMNARISGQKCSKVLFFKAFSM